MKKKLIILIVFGFFCASCDANYDLEIKEDAFVENISVTTDLTKQEIFNNMPLNNYFAEINQNWQSKYYDSEARNSKQAYKTNLETVENSSKLNLLGDFSFYDFYRSKAIKSCFNEFDMQKSDNYVLLRTNNKCALFDNYPLLENLTINIKTDLEVIVSNADNVNNHVYTWHLNRNNYKNKSVHLTYVLDDTAEEKNNEQTPEEKVEKEETINKENQARNNYNMFIFGACLGVLVVVIIFVWQLKKKRF